MDEAKGAEECKGDEAKALPPLEARRSTLYETDAGEAEQHGVESTRRGDFAGGLRELLRGRDLRARAAAERAAERQAMRQAVTADGSGPDSCAAAAAADDAAAAARGRERAAAGAVLASNIGVCCAALGSVGVGALHASRAAAAGCADLRGAAILHNLGLMALQNGHHVAAFDYLSEALPFFAMRSRSWLRIAECCLGAHRKAERRRLGESPLAAGVDAGAVDASGGVFDAPPPPYEPRAELEARGMTLPRAALFLRHCLRLERNGHGPDGSAAPRGLRDGEAVADPAGARAAQDAVRDARAAAGEEEPVLASPEPPTGYWTSVAAAALLHLCWLHLELGEWAKALDMAEELLAWPAEEEALTPDRRDAARLYATEARGRLGLRPCERDLVATPGRGGATLAPSDALNAAALVAAHDRGDEADALARATAAADADPHNRASARFRVATLVWLLVRHDRREDAADVLARCPADGARPLPARAPDEAGTPPPPPDRAPDPDVVRSVEEPMEELVARPAVASREPPGLRRR